MDGLYWVLGATALIFVGYYAYLFVVEKKVGDLEKRL